MTLFSLNSFFETDAQVETVPTEIAGTTFLLRPLDGIESEEYAERETLVERALFLLAHGLVDAETGRPIGGEGAKRLFARHRPLAMELARRLLELTESVYREEARRWEIAKKNIDPPTTGSDASIVDATA